MDNNFTVEIPVSEYDALKYNDTILQLLLTAIKKTAVLYYNNDERITLEYHALDDILRILLPETYSEIKTKLLADKQLEGEFGK